MGAAQVVVEQPQPDHRYVVAGRLQPFEGEGAQQVVDGIPAGYRLGHQAARHQLGQGRRAGGRLEPGQAERRGGRQIGPGMNPDLP